MKIQHFCNSFNLFQSGDSKIVCDPWVGNANRIAWMSYPVHKNGAQLLNKINPEYIYISHLHCDHFDEKLLIKYKFRNEYLELNFFIKFKIVSLITEVVNSTIFLSLTSLSFCLICLSNFDQEIDLPPYIGSLALFES